MMDADKNADLDRMLTGFGRETALDGAPRIQHFLHNPIKIFSSLIPESRDWKAGITHPLAGASSLSPTQAILAGLGEKLERYCVARPFSDSTIKTFSLAEVPKGIRCLSKVELDELQGVHPFQFKLAQCRLRPIQENQTFRWVSANRLVDGSEIWVPEAALVLNGGRSLDFEVTTNGCALATSKEKAILRASMELIERDNFMYFWWRKEAPHFVEFRQDMKLLAPNLFRAFGPWIQKIQLIYHPGETGVPTFFAVFKSDNKLRHPAIVVSAAAHFNPIRAVCKTLHELGRILNFKIRQWSKYPNPLWEDVSNFDQTFFEFEPHHHHYTFDQFARQLFFFDDLCENKFSIRLRDIANLETGSDAADFLELKSIFSSAGFDPIVVDQTSEDIRHLGYSVVRVMDTKIIDLNCSHAGRRWGKSRLFDRKIKSIFDLNHFPHPFP